MTQALPLRNWLQFSMIACLIAGSFSGNGHLLAAGVFLAVASTFMEWPGLLKLARVFVVIALVAVVFVIAVFPEKLPQLWKALVQGISFAALMMVLGMLRRPVRRSAFVRRGAEYLLAFQPRSQYAALNIGSHFLSLLFNVGVIAMIGDLAQVGGRDQIAKRPVVLAAMRGAALVSIWSPIGLGFAIVTTGVPALNALQLMFAALGFTLVALLLTSSFPMLPKEANAPSVTTASSQDPSIRPLLITLCICGLLLAITIGLHTFTGISFTLASVTVLPIFTLVWLCFEIGNNRQMLVREFKGTLSGLGDLRSESAIFLSANVIGAAIAIALSSLPFFQQDGAVDYPVLPVLLAILVVIPASAAFFIPNSILVVILAQLLGSSPIGTSHPLALGLTLCISWACAVSLSPISAMSLITAAQSGVSPQRVAWRWNGPFVGVVLTLAAVTVTAMVW